MVYELFISNIFAGIGVITLYLLIATVVGRMVYKAVDGSDSDKQFGAIMGGIFFPVTIILGLIVLWIKAICNVKLEAEPEVDVPYYESAIEDLRDEINLVRVDCNSTKEVPKKVVKSTKPSLKVGDVITGVSGNPDRYEVLYEGCKCRVLSINDEGSMRVILLDHSDKDAHKANIGRTFKAPSRNFVLFKSESTKVNTKKKTKSR